MTVANGTQIDVLVCIGHSAKQLSTVVQLTATLLVNGVPAARGCQAPGVIGCVLELVGPMSARNTPVISVTLKLSGWWLARQVPGVIWYVLELVGPLSAGDAHVE